MHACACSYTVDCGVQQKKGYFVFNFKKQKKALAVLYKFERLNSCSKFLLKNLSIFTFEG